MSLNKCKIVVCKCPQFADWILFTWLIYMERKLKPYLLHTSNAFLREWIIKEVT